MGDVGMCQGGGVMTWRDRQCYQRQEGNGFETTIYTVFYQNRNSRNLLSTFLVSCGLVMR